ncbi:hypothetical protein, conserved [Trypanosoma brucei gambiense DAL972]|uniref:Uncharacterized protein n=1 Tax=Trypanosoma brucei gambiense (strain MHOM/CI/86/DAL972) TaxID=679716 RepID=D0A415_TRYB9|nr:hypothetical protein, conserved [Trypanosoma brucei gambiense DAL972]CBH16009.1 hypothetical protein, conserved [Trypanosoma brucei gambiense DAL972]|eukprot:XP_011778273.1 hypothetical protein, conserved [Trypanosoma brucei gambiense DAL972]
MGLPFLCHTRVCLFSNKIPFVLCGSRFAPATLHAHHTAAGGGETLNFPELSSPSTSKEPSVGSDSPQKKNKKQALDALARWCGGHQQLLMRIQQSAEDTSAEVVFETPLTEVDSAAIRWLQGSTEQLTCGQSLLVCSFVCEVLYCQLNSASGGIGVEEAQRLQIHALTNRIAALLQRADESNKLESQPLSVLMSCAYVVQRLKYVDNPLFGETQRSLVKVPPSIMFALLHKLRGDGLGKLFQLDERTATDVCLSFLFIATEEHRQAFFSSGDAALVSNVLRRLVRHTASKTRRMRIQKEGDIIDLLTVDSPSDGGARQTPVCTSGTGFTSPSMRECAMIMQNVSFSSPSNRLELLLYLLCVRRNLAQCSLKDIELVPTVLSTVANIRSAEACSIRKKIISQLWLPENNPTLVAQLLVHSGESIPRYVTYLQGVPASKLSPRDAAQVILCAGTYLSYESLQLYIMAALRDIMPSSSLVTLGAATTSASVPATASVPTRVPACDSLETVLSVLLMRVEEKGGSLSEVEKDACMEYIRRLNELIDWCASAPASSPKLALQRLTLLTKLFNRGLVVHAPETVVELAVQSLQLDPGNTMMNTLKCVSEALPLVSDDKKRSIIIEKMISYSGTRTTSSVIRFLLLLAPLVDADSPHSCELVEQLLKFHTLNPHKLRQASVEGVAKGIDVYTLLLINGIDFLLASGDWRSSPSQLQNVITTWVRDYTLYVMDPARKQKIDDGAAAHVAPATKGEKTDVVQHQQPSRLNEGGELPTLSGPNDEELEQVFTCLLRAGVKLPHAFSSELLSRIRRLQAKRNPADGTDQQVVFPLPAHFVFCCKLDVPVEVSVTPEMMKYHIDACDYRIIHCVITAFFSAAGTFKHNINDLLLCNMRLASRSFELFIQRLGEEASRSFRPATVSSVVANTLRFVVNHITKQERCQRVLRKLNEKGGIEAGEEELEGDRSLIAEHTRLGELLTRMIAYLSGAHVKNVGLSVLDRLSLLSPACGEYLMMRLSTQLSEFTQVELLYLVQKYPKSQDLVAELLGKSDLVSSMDFGDYMRVMRNLPMPINALVIGAHLPGLNFQWCTRILSSLSVRHESVPLHLLASVLRRLNDVTESATLTDRNIAFVVLQKYLQFDQTSGDGGDLEERQRLIKCSCDKLLVLSRINSLDTLKEFLVEFPEALSGVICESLSKHVVQHIVGGLLKDLDGLLTLCRLLHRHKLLTSDVKVAIVDGFFMKTLQSEVEGRANIEGESSQGLQPLNSVRGASLKTTHPVSNVLALALLLSDGPLHFPGASNSSSTICGDNERCAVSSMFQVVKESYTSPRDRLLIANTLVGQKGPNALTVVAKEICTELIENCESVTSNDFSRLLQCVSRLKCWSELDLANSRFDEVFQRSCTQADAHSRCVAFRAVSFEADIFRRYESFMIPLLQETVDVMSNEDLETVLSSVLSLPFTEALESLIDAIGTRLLRMIDQCRRSALIRLLQCHAAFGIQDDALVSVCVATLTDQCGRDFRLDTAQVLALLQAAVDLDFFLPPKLVTSCFTWLEHHVENMTITQLGHAVRLAVDVEVGYTAAVHTLTLRALEQRDAIRSNASFREAVEMLCDEFSAEIPWHLRAPVLRRRYQSERLLEYLDKRRLAVDSTVA